jgi:hypothetical protein
MVNTALENQIAPTYSGLKKLNEKINFYNEEIGKAIDSAVETGEKIPVDKMFDGFDAMSKEILETSGRPIKGFNEFKAVKDEILEAEEMLKRKELTPREAQNKKIKMYRELEKEYSKLMEHPASVDARMAVAKNLRLAIEEIVPDIKYLNEKDGLFLELKDSLTRATERISNRDLLSLGTTAKAAGGGAIGGPTGLAAGLALGLLDSQPKIKSRLALIIKKLQDVGFDVKPTATGKMLGLYQVGRLNRDDDWASKLKMVPAH